MLCVLFSTRIGGCPIIEVVTLESGLERIFTDFDRGNGPKSAFPRQDFDSRAAP